MQKQKPKRMCNPVIKKKKQINKNVINMLSLLFFYGLMGHSLYPMQINKNREKHDKIKASNCTWYLGWKYYMEHREYPLHSCVISNKRGSFP